MKKKAIIIGLIGVAFTIVVLVLLFTGPRMKDQPSLKSFESMVSLPPEDAVPFELRESDREIKSIPVQNVQNISRGKVYYGYYCVFCHGDDGKGNGPVGISYIPKPADLSILKIKQYDSTQLYNAAFTGVGHAPVLERIIPPEHRPYIMLYLKNIQQSME